MTFDSHGAAARLRARRGATLIAPGFNRPAATRRHEAMGAAMASAVSTGASEKLEIGDPVTGKLLFRWGVSGLTADEIAGDRWRMV